MAKRRAFGYVFQRRRAGRAGLWCIRYRDASKRECFETVGPSRKLAVERLAQVHLAVTEERVTGRRPLRMMSLGEVWDSVVAPAFKAQHRAETFASESARAQVLIERFGAQRVSEISEGDVREALAALRTTRGLSGATFNRYRVLLARAWDLAVAAGVTDENPVRRIERASEPLPDRDVVRPVDVQAILATVKPRFWAPLALLGWTGARRGEIANARWSDYDATAGTLTIPGQRRKNGKPVTLYLGAGARGLLDRLRADRPAVLLRGGADFIFPDFAGPNVAKLSNAWLRARRTLAMPPGKPGRPAKDEKRQKRVRPPAAELPGAKLHGLRHAMGDALAARGAAPAVIAQALGHATLSTTLRYIRGRDDAAVKAAVLGVTDGGSEPSSGAFGGATDGATRKPPPQVAGA